MSERGGKGVCILRTSSNQSNPSSDLTTLYTEVPHTHGRFALLMLLAKLRLWGQVTNTCYEYLHKHLYLTHYGTALCFQEITLNK
jgi:hypothetical protein